ncbi:MAG TPA: hypothetical protein VMM77_04945 [Gemmatimonadaceae bacterium]|nr:hypothetical protein [Gemmatimonadaceae bacterium]
MKLQWMVVPALVAGLLASTNLALADQFQPGDGAAVPECVTAAGLECRVAKTDKCTNYTIVHIKIGVETVITRQCSERTVTETYFYWKQY